jgi:hypothetical protein
MFFQLNLTPQLYSILVERAENLIRSWEAETAAAPLPPPPSTNGRRGGRSPSPLSREETLELIGLDVSRTFPQLCIFQKVGRSYSVTHKVHIHKE